MKIKTISMDSEHSKELELGNGWYVFSATQGAGVWRVLLVHQDATPQQDD